MVALDCTRKMALKGSQLACKLSPFEWLPRPRTCLGDALREDFSSLPQLAVFTVAFAYCQNVRVAR